MTANQPETSTTGGSRAPDNPTRRDWQPAGSAAADPLIARWRARDSLIGMAIGLVGGYIVAGYIGSVCGGLLLGGLWPAARRSLGPRTLGRAAAVVYLRFKGAPIHDPNLQVAAASTIGEISTLVVGGVVGLIVASTSAHADHLLFALVGMVVLYEAGGGSGRYLVRAWHDAIVPADGRAYVCGYYALRGVGLVLGLAGGLVIGAMLRDPLQVLVAGAIGMLAGGLMAGCSCAASGIVPPWEWRMLGESRLKLWASRAYRTTARVRA